MKKNSCSLNNLFFIWDECCHLTLCLDLKKPNQTPTNRKLDLPSSVGEAASKHDFEVAGHAFEALPESLRPPRIVRVGLIQHQIVLPTTADVKDQRDAILQRIGSMIHAAAQAKVNIICLQEAWSKFFLIFFPKFALTSLFAS